LYTQCREKEKLLISLGGCYFMANIRVAIIMGSDSDLETMSESAKILESFNIGYEIIISSAHRTLNKTLKYVSSLEKRGVEIVIAGAGMSAHLAGVIAGEVTLPVIGVPMHTKSLGGVDSLYSMVQMPGGVPVATMGIGRSGAKNAGILAVQILALKYPSIKKELKKFKVSLAEEVINKDKKLQKLGYKEYLKENK
jgi:5-(carboxyamino)imidazole ribonucleotide mutase